MAACLFYIRLQRTRNLETLPYELFDILYRFYRQLHIQTNWWYFLHLIIVNFFSFATEKGFFAWDAYQLEILRDLLGYQVRKQCAKKVKTISPCQYNAHGNVRMQKYNSVGTGLNNALRTFI